jgi:hypothetical protein
MGKLEDERSLINGGDITIDRPLFIPAKQSVRLILHMPTYSFKEVEPDVNSAAHKQYIAKLIQHINSNMANLDGFVLYVRQCDPISGQLPKRMEKEEVTVGEGTGRHAPGRSQRWAAALSARMYDNVHRKTTMKATLTLRPTGRIGGGPNLLTDQDRVFKYEVVGLPPGQSAAIAEMDHRWQILRTKDGVQGTSTGRYHTAEEALAELQKEFSE